MDDSAYFSVVMEEDGILAVTMSGFWTDEVMDRFETAFAAKVAQVCGRQGPSGCLVDASLSPPQSARVVARHAEVRHRYAGTWTSRSALVMPNAIAKLQAKRVYSAQEARVFGCAKEARNWLRKAHTTQ